MQHLSPIYPDRFRIRKMSSTLRVGSRATVSVRVNGAYKFSFKPIEMIDYSEPLTQEQIAVLKQMLQELHGAGLDWDHPFTQCRLQNAIFAMRNMVNMERDACVIN